jgi:hypothetical protein
LDPEKPMTTQISVALLIHFSKKVHSLCMNRIICISSPLYICTYKDTRHTLQNVTFVYLLQFGMQYKFCVIVYIFIMKSEIYIELITQSKSFSHIWLKYIHTYNPI